MNAQLSLLQSARRIGILFSGGSSRCVFQVGAIETLDSLGIQPAVCLGVSGGAWNAAAVAAGNSARLRSYWRFFSRMPYIDISNLAREHSPFIWSRLHERAFARYVGRDALRAAPIPAFIALTRLRDRSQVILDARSAEDPLRLLLASNYLPPFYTHAPQLDGERYGDGGFSNNIPYDYLFAQGCDAVVVLTNKGESEGGLYRNPDDHDHLVHDPRVVVIRPRHRLPLGFVERRWELLAPIADLGGLRAREVLLDESHPLTEELVARGRAVSYYFVQLRRKFKRATPVVQGE